MTHKFDTEVAREVGVNAAILYDNIQWWCEKNRVGEKHFYDGIHWTYNSIKAWHELFPYFSESQIKTALKKLVDTNYILEGNHNKSAYDRTKWYCDIRLLHLSKIANGFVKNRQPIPSNKPSNKPITAANQNLTACENKKDESLLFPDLQDAMTNEKEVAADFSDIWKKYTLTLLAGQGRRGGSKKKAFEKYKKLREKYSKELLYDLVYEEAGLKLGLRDLERIYNEASVKQFIEEQSYGN